MSPRDPAVYLEDVQRHAEAALRFAADCTLEQYLGDDKTRAAVERALEVCGEAMRQLHATSPALADQIPHARNIIGFRNILAHGYAALDHARVYDVLTNDLTPLLNTARRLLEQFPILEP